MVKKRYEEENIVYLIGDLDLAAASDLEAELEPLINQGDRTLTLNLGELKYIDSTGIGLIVSILKRRAAMKAEFEVQDIPYSVQRLFDLTGISGYLRKKPAQAGAERKEQWT